MTKKDAIKELNKMRRKAAELHEVPYWNKNIKDELDFFSGRITALEMDIEEDMKKDEMNTAMKKQKEAGK